MCCLRSVVWVVSTRIGSVHGVYQTYKDALQYFRENLTYADLPHIQRVGIRQDRDGVVTIADAARTYPDYITGKMIQEQLRGGGW